MVKKIEDIHNGLDTVPACDRQTDGRTDILPRHIRAMHTRRAVKTQGGPKMRTLYLFSYFQFAFASVTSL